MTWLDVGLEVGLGELLPLVGVVLGAGELLLLLRDEGAVDGLLDGLDGAAATLDGLGDGWRCRQCRTAWWDARADGDDRSRAVVLAPLRQLAALEPGE
jgi:hypothetical protein